MAWILPKGSTIYEEVYTYPGIRYDPIKTTSRDRKIDDETYNISNRSDSSVWGSGSTKRWSDYVKCTGGHCKMDDLVNESVMPAKPAKSTKTSKSSAKPKTPAAPKVRKTPFRSLFVKGSEWKFKSDCTIRIFREYKADYSGAIWSISGVTGTIFEEIKEILNTEVSAGVVVKPLSKSESYYPATWDPKKGITEVYRDFTAIEVEIGSFKPGKEMRDGNERKVRYLVDIRDIEDLVEQTNDFTPKSFVIEIDGELYQENIYTGYPSKSEFVHMNSISSRKSTSRATDLGIGCT